LLYVWQFSSVFH